MARTLWKPGQSGNPSGKPPGTRHKLSVLREGLLTEDQAGEVVTALLTAARQGDVQAAGILLDRVWPKLRPVAQPVQVPIPEGSTLTEAGLAVLQAAASGQVGTDAAHDLIASLGALGRLVELDEMKRRLERLEALSDDRIR